MSKDNSPWDDLIFRYPGGKMIIHMDCFFPATEKQVRKLYQTMQQSMDIDDLVDQILQHMDKRNIRIEKELRACAQSYSTVKTRYEEKKTQLQSRKKANGVPIRKDEVESWRSNVRGLEEEWRGHKRHYDLLMREQKRISQNRLQLLTLNGRC